MLTLQPGILSATFAALRDCGGGERECVVYWLGPQAEPELVASVLQPVHQASPFHYEIDSDWLTTMLLDLRTRRESVRAQVHTHPGAQVRHSPTDDAFALAPAAGFVSLVLPHFAMGPVTLTGSYAVTVTPAGWVDGDPKKLIRCR